MQLVPAAAVRICSCHWTEDRGPQNAAMDPLLRGKIGREESGAVPSSVVSCGDAAGIETSNRTCSFGGGCRAGDCGGPNLKVCLSFGA